MDKAAGCKQKLVQIHLDVSEIYILDVTSMYLIIGLDKAAGCKQDVFEKHLDVSHRHLKFDINSHKFYKSRWVKELWTRQPFKN